MPPNLLGCNGSDEIQGLRNALLQLSMSVKDKNDAITFLLSKNSSKNYSKRFISWLLALDIIPNDNRQWTDACNNYHANYQSKAELLIQNVEEPLASLSNSDAEQIGNDLIRTMCYFNKMAAEINVKSPYTDYAFYHTSRILTLLTLADTTFKYTQGCDRYIYITYLFTLVFCLENGIPLSFAESSTYILSSKLMQISNISHYLDDPNSISAHFEGLDARMMEANPSVMQAFASSNQSSVHFALRWEIMLFAEEHNFEGLMLIWDNIIAHHTCASSYIEALCIAHFKQAPSESLSDLQHFKKWDYKKLLLDADKEFNKGSSILNNVWKTFALCAIVGVVFIGQAAMH